MLVTVIGMGKIGLPLAAQFASQGHRVTGVDINQQTVDSINGSTEPFPGEAFLQEALDVLVPRGQLRATTNYSEAIPDSDVVVVVVPLFVDEGGLPDFGWMDAATRDIGSHLTPNTLVCYETTLPVGTTRTRWKPMLEKVSGLAEGRDFHVVFSPERVLTGRVFEDLRKYPKIIGGLSETGARAAQEFYEASLEFDERPDLPRQNGVWDLGTAEAAELVKLAETTYRDVNIGLANQFALFAESAGIDVFKVIEAANSQPYSHIHAPGVSVGGHCIPIYPRLFLSNSPGATIVTAAREANANMPAHAVARLSSHLDLSGRTVAVLGATYRTHVKETAFSGVFDVCRHLAEMGAVPKVHDPLLNEDELQALGLRPYLRGQPVDAVLLHTAHDEYSRWGPEDCPTATIVVDGRRVLSPARWRPIPVLTLGVAGDVEL